ncbi:MAG TPA: hypothetical protein VGH14_22155 [Solirubrobacterales bacterium]|jgi:hypothetical protein
MNPSSHRNLVRVAGAVLGVGLALALILLSRPGAAGSPLPAAVDFTLAPSGDLEVTAPPQRPAFVAAGLRPGGRRALGGFGMRNQTGENLAVALRADADSTALNGLVRVRVRRVGAGLLADTTLEGLERRPLRLRLASGQRVRLRLEAWIPPDVLNGYSGRLVRVTLDPDLRRIGGRG